MPGAAPRPVRVRVPPPLRVRQLLSNRCGYRVPVRLPRMMLSRMKLPQARLRPLRVRQATYPQPHAACPGGGPVLPVLQPDSQERRAQPN